MLTLKEARRSKNEHSIRYYEKMGLLRPNRNKETDYRDFSKEDVDALMRIVILRRTGLPISEVQHIMRKRSAQR
jgi:DNA-binding transcriptional MerR regulator